MQELIAQLLRLYLPGGTVPDGLSEHLEGHTTLAFGLAADNATRAIAIAFEPGPDRNQATPWERLCILANAVQSDLGWPAPAVSVSGVDGFRLWLSFAQPLPLAQAQDLVERLRARYPEAGLAPARVDTAVELPPCLAANGKWAAFINPGMGASFADEPGLEMMPPALGQAAFLQGLETISAAQLAHALQVLGVSAATGLAPAAPAAAATEGLLLRDASLEDIVRHLQAQNIEPTFRFVLRS